MLSFGDHWAGSVGCFLELTGRVLLLTFWKQSGHGRSLGEQTWRILGANGLTCHVDTWRVFWAGSVGLGEMELLLFGVCA